ncbi:hypothetical protein GHO29_11475 [Pseudomonas helleri]|uniref:Uncharacterized protein n=1 Tax=Pseudomonas helleri TaxID=1608996 RepID=A0A6A7YST8_9PSED|nr:hypothetical protein [Pseudomonas helleri]MQT78855.1 hypothetical protein [Pseudomonas helleri]MQU14969.1 hypothetical protein [Pseudomonas helleri]MQU27107.1 hypothetical protein [Pseudomonas helleri]
MDLVCDKAIDHVSNKKSLLTRNSPIRLIVIEQGFIQFRKRANAWQGEALAKKTNCIVQAVLEVVR